MSVKAALAASWGLGVAFLAACSDSPTAANLMVPRTTRGFAIGDVTNGPMGEAAPGVIVLCKTGDVGGSFVFTRTTEGPAVDPNGGVASNQTVDTGKCLEVARDNSPSGSGSHITITEQSALNTTFSITACRFRGYALDGVTLNPPEDCTYTNGGDLFLNHFHGYAFTYQNDFTPPATGCTNKKGWYQSKKATLTGVDGLSVTTEAAFFKATPNKPGTVSFSGSNSLLNLYQHLLAALENGGAGGPEGVQDAIADAQDGTTVTGTVLTTTLSKAEISDLIGILTAFNDGTLAGWPLCD